MDINVKMHARVDTHKVSREIKPNSRNIDVALHVKWIPPMSLQSDTEGSTTMANIDSSESSLPPDSALGSKRGSDQYSPVCGKEVVEENMGDRMFKPTKEQYDDDPLGPRMGQSSEAAPPVKRVYAIHGINLPTAVSGVLCRKPGLAVSAGKVRSRFVPDSSVKITGDDGTIGGNYFEVGGDGHSQILETEKTRQVDMETGDVIDGRSGDSTVPYWSLQVPKTWKNSCDVNIAEIVGAEHRAILNDKRFHKILLDYLDGKGAFNGVIE